MLRTAVLTLVLGLTSPLAAQDPKPLKVLFLGDNAGHRPAQRFKQLEPVFAKRGIELTYTDKVADLNEKTLAGYDALVVYANVTKITPDQEKALLDFVEGGKGFVPLHCASYCFLNSPKYIALVGAQFRSHGTGTFTTTVAAPDHPIMSGYKGFDSWDETYVHTKHNEKDRTVLEYRTEGDLKEPWTWVRTQGKGRIFYTAWGHDQRTWGHPGFQELVERGLRWTVGQDPTKVRRSERGAGSGQPAPTSAFSAPNFPDPEMTPKRTDVKPFEFDDVGRKIPNYTPSRTWGVQGEPHTKMQRPLPAEESQKHVVTPKGFRAEVFVTEKELGGKPICMAWDEKGRLWASITLDYPNELKPPQKGRDRIVVCEDTDGDNKADRVTTFAENLSIATSLFFARGGVIAFDATQTVFLKDTDGDGKADVREVLFGTWNQRDTHGGPSNMQYGLDNWVWAMQGYNDSRLTVGGEQHRFRQGFFRFKPDGSKLEFVRSTNNNTWGLGLSEEGIVFGSTANGNPSEYMPIPNRYYEAVRGWAPSLVLRGIADSNKFAPVTDHVRQVDYHGGFTAAAGHALYTARNYPQEYWNRTAFVAEPTGHLVATFVIRQEGSHFRSSNRFNLFASDDEWTAPIMAEVGPDGNVWVLDWYNFIVQHNPTPQGFKTGRGAAYESDLRDKKHGRIYRIVHESAKPGEQFSLAGATPEKLVATLRHDNLFWRRHAQRLLVERGQPDVVPELIALVRDQSVDAIGLNVGAIHALWTLHGLGAIDSKHPEALAAAVAALKHPSAGVRRNAVQVLPKDVQAVTAIQSAGVLIDPEPQVRLMAILALADRPASAAAGFALAELLTRTENATDRWIPDAITCAAAVNADHFLKAIAARRQPSTRLLDVATIVADHHARGAPVETVGGLVAALGEADAAVADAVVRGLARGWPAKTAPKLDDTAEAAIEKLSGRLPPDRRALLVRLAATWGSRHAAKFGAEVAKTLAARVNDPKAAVADRVAAASELVGYQSNDADLVKKLLDAVTPQAPPELGSGILRAVQASEATGVAALIVERLPGMTPTVRSTAFTVLLSRPQWTRALLAALDAGTVQLSDLALDQRQALAQHPDERVRRAALAVLRRGGALPSADRQKVIEELTPILGEKGDPAAGQVVFKNQCAKCHTHSGEGTAIGPDLTGMAAHPKEELLVNVLDPSRSVEGNFRVYKVVTKDGVVLQGMLAGESRTAVELVDAEAKRHTVLREDIDELTGSAKSLMPDGFEKMVNRQELTNLLAFLTKKGKYLPLPLDRVATAVSTKGMFYSEEAAAERLVFPDWKPKTVDGVPFVLTDPQGDRVPNVVMLNGPNGYLPPKMPRSVSLPCNTPAKAIHLLSGVSGWGFPYSEKGSTSLIVRLHYAGGQSEDHPLVNGEHFADYIRRVDVPGSKFAFNLRGKQVRMITVTPKEQKPIERIELVKGPDATAPVVVAVTVEVGE